MYKQIEEMSSYLIGKNVTGSDSTKVLSLGYLTVKEIASILVNAGYRKIPEGAVVISADYELPFDNKDECEYLKSRCKEIGDVAYNQARKETAEKYHAKVNEVIDSVPNATKEFVEAWKAKNDEIAKEITEGEV
jgi:hypothetical protein